MTLDEFIERLKQTPRDWKVTPNGQIRRDDLVTDADGEWLGTCCPVSACGYPPESSSRFLECGTWLGLSEDDTYLIVYAADNDTKTSRFDPAIRARLLEACGLAEESHAGL